ncbi:unnamed protein product [Urochloa decumbens]|uniref:F-box domain-containing protein n=1 Tax=Urochloa decumbens TaxID=240449 RepID=A0ABC9G810_9POAL
MKHTIPDDILEDIFLRLDSDVWLLRAASTCRQWCRVVSDTGFHRRFRTIHGPPIAGVFYVKGAEDWRQRQWLNFEPMPSAAAIDDRHLSLDFLRDSDATPRVWSIRDTRGSLLLLQRCPEVGDYGHPDLVVCEPLTRRYEVISTRRLVPCRNCDPIAYLPACYDAAVLSFGRNHGNSTREISIGAQARRSMGHTTVAVYWYTGQGKVHALDKTSADFSCSLLPDMEEWSLSVGQTELGVTAGRDGKDRIVHSGDGGKIKVFVRLQGSSGDWGLEKIIELSMVTCALPGYLPWVFSEEPAIIEILRSPKLVLRLQRRLLWYGLDVVTGEAEDVSGFVDFPHPCELPWPPRLPCVR